MFTRAAKHMAKWLSYPSSLLAAFAMVAIVFVTLAVVADVFMRYVFNSPIRGVWDLSGLAFALIVWGPMAMAALKGSHIAMTFLLDRFPRVPKLALGLIIALVSGGILGVIGWRLLMYGIELAESKSRTDVLNIPYEPFAYFAAFACVTMALAFLVGVLEVVGKIRKEPQALGEIQKEPETVERIERMKGSST